MLLARLTERFVDVVHRRWMTAWLHVSGLMLIWSHFVCILGSQLGSILDLYSCVEATSDTASRHCSSACPVSRPSCSNQTASGFISSEARYFLGIRRPLNVHVPLDQYSDHSLLFFTTLT